jgi:AAA15 family ATPase/GTPase
MLLEFRLRNFRSVRDEQVLNLLASSADKSQGETHLAPTGLKALPHAVRSAVIYGPNASGKSNLLRGLAYMRGVVADSATVIQPGQSYNVQPFRLDAASAQRPSDFEISFLVGGVRHQYAFSMTPQRIVSESLLVYTSIKPTQLFSRQHVVGQDDAYEFSAYLRGPRRLWQEATRANALFLSTAAQLNSEQLGPVFEWIVRNIVVMPANAMVMPDATTAMLSTEEGRHTVQQFLSDADFSIAAVSVVSRRGVRTQFTLDAAGLQAAQEERDLMVPLFEHRTAQGAAIFELHDESEGTQRLFGLIAPFMDCLAEGRLLLVDELDSSLHTLLVRRLVSMFHSDAHNPKGAQLVFTTHDTSLLDQSLFRRDQIWFTEKDALQATRLYPLSDFSPRKQEALERGYLAGRYGAVPYLPPLEDQSIEAPVPTAH